MLKVLALSVEILVDELWPRAAAGVCPPVVAGEG
jgi:predicted anti-sigma-YlaC factor YlaD